jgi:hypothetical protein
MKTILFYQNKTVISMKNRILLFSTLLLLCSCTAMKVEIPRPFLKSESIKKIALIEVMIGKPVQPILPLLDAAMFNAKMDKISDQVFDAERKKLNNYRETLAFHMKKKFNCEIIYGKELQTLTNFEELKKKVEKKRALNTESNLFPVVLLSDGDFNPFSFENGAVNSFFREELPATKAYVSEICKQLEVDAIAINFSYLDLRGVTSFGISTNARLNTDLYIFHKDGRWVGHGKAYSQVMKITGREVGEYQIILDEYNTIIDPLTTEITKPKAQ